MLQNVQRGPNISGDSLSASMTVTGSATANSQGAWTQIFASTATDSGYLILMPDDITVSATNSATLVEVGIGASGQERTVIDNIAIGGWGHGAMFQCPFFIPAGTRVSLRVRSIIASKVLNGRLTLLPAAALQDAPQWSETWGITPSVSQAQNMTTPSVAGTKTAWQQISAGITRDTSWLTWTLSSAGTNIAAAKGGFDIGYGGAGVEQPIMQNARWEQLGTETIRPCCFPVQCNLQAGTRLVVRWDSTSIAAGSIAQAAVYCFS